MKSSVAIAVLTLFVSTSLSAPLPGANGLSVQLEARTPIVGMLFRGAGRAGKKLPNKAGKNSIKNQGKQKETPAQKKQFDQMAQRWGKYTGKPASRECVKGVFNTLSRTGGFNGVFNCDKNRKKSNAAKASEARMRAFAMAAKRQKNGKKKREFIEDELEGREPLDADLEERSVLEYLLDELD